MALRCGETRNRSAICQRKVALFFNFRDAGVAVVGWIAEDDEDGVGLLDGFGGIAFSGERGKAES
jgi:hypothetical protein